MHFPWQSITSPCGEYHSIRCLEKNSLSCRRKPLHGTFPYLKLRGIPDLLGSGNNRRLARHSVLLTWLFRLGRVADGTYITNRYKNDGPGSQLCHTLTIQALCHSFGVPYAHTPFSIVTQKPHRVFDQSRCAAWESHVKLGEGFPLATSLGLPIIGCDAPAAKHLRTKHEGVKSSMRSAVRVAVHVRRGDVDQFNHPSRYTDEAKIMGTNSRDPVRCRPTRLERANDDLFPGKREDVRGFLERGYRGQA